MNKSDKERLDQLREHYAKLVESEQMGLVKGWFPSECEAVFLLRLIDELEGSRG